MPNIYKITNSRGRVVNLSLFKTTFRLGDDIIGILDFSDSSIQCIQVCSVKDAIQIPKKPCLMLLLFSFQ